MDKMRWVGLAFVVVTVALVGAAVWAAVSGEGEQGEDVAAVAVTDSLAAKEDAEGPRGTGVRLGISGKIEYVVRDASGNIKQQMIIHNTSTSTILDAARDRLGGADGTLSGLSDDTGLFDNVQLVNTDLSGSAPSQAQLSEPDNLNENNPLDGTQSDGATGVYQTVAAFTASGAVVIEELQLTSGAGADDTPETPGAFQNVSITLASGDSLTITWTVTIS